MTHALLTQSTMHASPYLCSSCKCILTGFDLVGFLHVRAAISWWIASAHDLTIHPCAFTCGESLQVGTSRQATVSHEKGIVELRHSPYGLDIPSVNLWEGRFWCCEAGIKPQIEIGGNDERLIDTYIETLLDLLIT